MKPGQPGFCGVRQNYDGQLVTLNYGRATHVTQESIETEAVFHYAPGAPILSLGNVGCMMNCDYCHNWKTSQARLISGEDVHYYTPERVVEMALERKIPVISWTYNDPVVWHEFVLDTSRLAKQNGLHTLFKSAFFISLEGAAELCDVIDIFSVSIKSMNDGWYRKITKGWLQPVLDATKFVYAQGKHVEASNLMVTDANDSIEDAKRVADWVLTNLSDTVPLHFVRFHPDYKYTHVGRTPIDRLEAARETAQKMGVRYCYLGNVYDSDAVHTYCAGCKGRLIERYGLNANPVGLDGFGCCRRCGRRLEYVHVDYARPADGHCWHQLEEGLRSARSQRREFRWHGDINALHVEVNNPTDAPGFLSHRRLNRIEESRFQRDVPLGANESFRFILSKAHSSETGVELLIPARWLVKLYEVYDRAHFPTVDVDTGQADQDCTPLPFYTGTHVQPNPALRILTATGD
jgi:pyruvate formate lyase activating enzyme